MAGAARAAGTDGSEDEAGAGTVDSCVIPLVFLCDSSCVLVWSSSAWFSCVIPLATSSARRRDLLILLADFEDSRRG
jgi:hypothetical protein